MKSITIRMIQAGEEEHVFSLVERGFDEHVRSDFTQEGITNFFRATHAMISGDSSRHVTMVAEADNQVVGMIAMKDHAHVSLLFVDSSFQRQGIGRSLLDCALSACRQQRPDVSEIGVHSSVSAVPFYAKLGFEQRTQEQEENGIRFVKMVRKIGRGDAPCKCL